MNRLSRSKRATILNLLVEGVSLRATARITDTSINTVTRLLVDAGNACAEYHDQAVRYVRSKRVQVDEIWTFTYAKDKNVPAAKAAPEGAGDTWTWTAMDADSKLVVSWLVGPRDAGSAYTLMHDLADRLTTRVQLTSDGLQLYVGAVEDAFGADIDYAQLIKIYGTPREPESRYSPATCTGTIRRIVTGHPAHSTSARRMWSGRTSTSAWVSAGSHGSRTPLGRSSRTRSMRSRSISCSTTSAGFTSH